MCLKPEELLGKDIAGFDWESHGEAGDCSEQPWVDVLAGKILSGSVTMRLKNGLNEAYIFTVNASPITATEGKIRGVLITFDDITEVEAKNKELHRTLLSLENSKREITRQNQELQVLAARDPLTGALNRRSLFQGLNTLFTEIQEEGEELSCIMVDIDHFKSVNDQFGHAVGDEVIKLLTHILTECSRSGDLVGRIGGEEFIIVLPETDIKVAARVAERMRLAVQEGDVGKFANALRITSSFGIATLSDGADSSLELVDRADKALYAAKENGRNRVISWSSTLAEDAAKGKLKSPLDEPVLESAKDRSSGQMVEGELGRVLSVVDKFHGQDNGVVAFPAHDTELDQALLEKERMQDIKLSCDEPNDLPNRALLSDRIEQGIKRTQRNDTQIAVLVMDVGTLQRVNDTLGLAVGEKLAKIIITRLKQTLRLTDTVAMCEQDELELLFTISRLGSNEIAVLLTDLEQPEIVTSILQRIFSALKKPVEVESNEIYLNVNVGVSVFPLDGGDPETLIRNASSAMREAKQNQGSNNFRFYAEDINQRAKKQIQLEAELHRAVEREELIVYYQPKVDLKTGNIQGMEALVRWQHPLLGTVPPNDFIPLAEQTGLIEDISRWVIRAVCRQISFWQKAGYGTVPVAVNLSPVEFRNPDLADQIIALVDEFGIPASAFELEITETAVMQSMDTAAGILEKLSTAGLCISLDDFGTGYSSLSYLRRFPISTVKIDRSFIADFVQDSNDAAIVSAIIAMCHSLGLRVVAEGVETEEQLRFLQDLQCDEVQGYLISRPVPGKQVNELLAQPAAIRRMIMKQPANDDSLVDHQDACTAPGMVGLLNDLPQHLPIAPNPNTGRLG